MGTSLRFRITVRLLVAMTLAMAALCAFLYVAARHVLYESFDGWLHRESQALSHVIEEHSKGKVVFEYDGIPAFENPLVPAYFQFWKPDGSPLASSRLLKGAQLPKNVGVFMAPLISNGTLPDGRAGRFLQASFIARWESDSVPIAPLPRQLFTVVIARDTAEIQANLAALRVWLLGLGALVVLLIAGIAGYSVWRGLAPTSVLATEIARIDEYHLGDRVVVPDLPNELEVPVTKLNELLGRLDESFARERRFTADVSHELRTPLSGMKAILEVAAARVRSADDYRVAMGSALRVVADMQSMIENLLTLARLDARDVELHIESFVVRDLVDDCWTPLEGRGQHRNLSFRNDLTGQHLVKTDRDKLRIVVANLLSNAVEYTTAGGQIVVSATGDGTLLSVWDSGPTIPSDALSLIFDRFFRADKARTEAGVHCGIGLSLVKSVAFVLGLGVSAENPKAGGVRFRVAVLPGGKTTLEPAAAPGKRHAA